MKTLILFVFLFLYSFNIQNDKVSKVNPDNFFQIKYETLLKKKETIGLSQIASNIEYIQLETKDDCLMWGGVKRYLFTDDFIFISNKDHILKFSREGKFIRKIGSPGRGPGEIDLIVNMSILPDKKLNNSTNECWPQTSLFHFRRRFCKNCFIYILCTICQSSKRRKVPYT